MVVVDDQRLVQCPYCFEGIEFYVDPGTVGSYVEDCAVCCRPWRVFLSRDEEGGLLVQL
jgi:hypothetical protein